MGAEPADKPGSVVDSHSSRRRVTATLKQPTRRHRGPRHRLPIWSCSRWGLPCRPVARLAVRSYRTVSPLPDPFALAGSGPSAVCSLLHFPSARAPQALPGTVPCGARTFLGMLAHDATVWPTPRGRILRLRRTNTPRFAEAKRGPRESSPPIPRRCRGGPLTKGAWGERSGGKEGRTCICVPGRGACSGVTRFRSAAAPPGAGDLRPLLQPCTQPRLTPRGRRRRAPCAVRR